MSKNSQVPAKRLHRMLHLGKLVGGLAGGAVSEGVKQFSQGKRPSKTDLLLTPGNAHRLAERLAELRGAAMKVGQLLSMEAGEFLPKELTDILARLREDAYSMPLGQIHQQLSNAWGEDWSGQFSRFSFTPLAAASIGQVHEATLKDGRHLAVKIQYPGIRESIDSDVDNVISLLNIFRVLPKTLDLSPLLDEAKQQLHDEANYETEADYLHRYTEQVSPYEQFEVPGIVESLTHSDVLAMSFVHGDPIESLADAPADLRNSVATQLLDLAFKELFEWGLVQTDPNFANFRYNHETGRIGLLDFGACRNYSEQWRNDFRHLISAAHHQERSTLLEAAETVGYLKGGEIDTYQEAIVQLLTLATEPTRHSGPYAFASNELSQRISQVALQLRGPDNYHHLPPPEVLFLHRKVAGLYLLFARIHAKVDVAELATPYLKA